MHASKLVSLSAAATAAGLAGWMGIMRFLPQYSGVRAEHVNRWLLLDTVEFTTLVGFASTAHRRPHHSRAWAMSAAVLIGADAVVDVMTSRQGRERRQASLMAGFIEIPSSLGLGAWALLKGRPGPER
ncbi:hypothetical protein SAMN05443377_12911 [Propionibacterium cyclohexanicum]|uniref:Uncharacterized protein n=1 Tax=Propionibacterium cyclohexanicum TaxID=64702 RepID=A0A1H9TVF0_9ACTN|nr:hypothetical protein [Propionibacterium cyclohexanicum]SES00978.1 hypothetical protein SAMN05443377_12911 [Propionibacterium cyclohexanicum]